MTQLSRLHISDIANGNVINADHLNNEFNQLLSESNAQDTRLGTIESGTITFSGNKSFTTIPTLPATDPSTANQAVRKSYVDALIKTTINGLVVSYSNANQVQIGVGNFRDDTNTQTFTVSSAITVSMNTSGANGLDTGTEAANAWYYVWVVGKTDGTVAGLLSLSSSSPTMPSGYTLKRLLPMAIRNDASSAICPFMVTQGWPYRPTVMYTDVNTSGSPYQVLGSGTATSFTSVSTTSMVPPVARACVLWSQLARTGSGTINGSIRQAGSSANVMIGMVDGLCNYQTLTTQQTLNASQAFEYQLSTNQAQLSLAVLGFVVTEINLT